MLLILGNTCSIWGLESGDTLTALATSRPRDLARDRWCDPGRTDDEKIRLQNAQDAEKRGQENKPSIGRSRGEGVENK